MHINAQENSGLLVTLRSKQLNTKYQIIKSKENVVIKEGYTCVDEREF